MNSNMTRTSLGQGGKGETDWKRVDALTDEDISRAIADDPDSFEIDSAWRQRAKVLRPGHSGFGT